MSKRQISRSKLLMFGIGVLMLLLVLLIGTLVTYQQKLNREQEDNVTYKRHYMFIAQEGKNSLSEDVFEEAKKYGEKNGIYVEQLEDNSFSEYTTEDYLKMSIAMKVDGIIVEGCDRPKVKELINEAVDNNIPVVTVFSDCKSSKRQTFIELGDYNLGREYGRWLINVAKGKSLTALLLKDDSADRDSVNMVYTGILETLSNEGNHLQVNLDSSESLNVANENKNTLQVNLRTEKLDDGSKFGAAVRIREILMDEENQPDVILCMNEQDTEAVYQSLIDHNLIGKIQVIGYCVSDTILQAVEKGSIAAAINVDTAQMGRQCVDVLDEYIESGHASDYIMVDTNVVTKDNIERYLNDEKKN